MASLAMRNLFHDRVRFAVTITGVVFAVVLIAMQMGLFLGFSQSTTNLILNSGADIWICSEGVRYVESGVPFSERKLNQVRATPGVAWAEKHILLFSRWKRPDGGEEGTQIVGFNPDRGAGGPWNLVAGRVEDLKDPDAVIIDELYRQKLAVTHLGQVVEIRGRRARVVGFTSGIRSFTTAPAVFTSFKNAQSFAPLRENQTMYILVKAAAGTSLRDVQRELQARLKGVDVHTTEEFARKTRIYWLFGTGAGITVLMAAALGLLVGIVVVAQTLYATTVDHLREYGTLKAIGASNTYIYRVIIRQAVISAAIGYGLGLAISLAIVEKAKGSNADILMPWQLALALLALTVMMCVGASMISIHKATSIDPAMVFKN